MSVAPSAGPGAEHGAEHSAEHSAEPGPEFVDIDWAGRRVSIEHAWLAPEHRSAPLLVFLHEGLGSLAMWRDFPQRLCSALGCRGLVYSRPGYGRSTARGQTEHWSPDFMHRQAQQVLPALLQALGLDTAHDKPWLFGHSDGGSIALLHAAHCAGRVAGVVVLAPHVMVEPLALTSIAKTRDDYLHGGLRQRLARYHDEPDSAFWGWNRAWLDPAFSDWNIEADLQALQCPLLAVQGLDDEYGTLAQIHRIARRLPHTRLLELAQCGHAPHRDQGPALIAAVQGFFAEFAGHHPIPTGDKA